MCVCVCTELRVSGLWDDVFYGPDVETAVERVALVSFIDAVMKRGVRFSYAYLSEYPELADIDDA